MRDTPEGRDSFARRISAPLQAPEWADATLGNRVMQAVQAEEERVEAARARSWWRRPITVQVTPLSALAVGASVAVVMLAGASAFTSRDRIAPATPSAAAQADTVHVIRFVLVAPGASSVAVAGDFNRWDAHTHQLQPAGAAGVWIASVPLAAGRHEYAFVIDGTRWVADPAADLAMPDEFGGRSSVMTVGTRDQSRSG